MTKVIQFLIIGVLLIMSDWHQNQAHAQNEKLSLDITCRPKPLSLFQG